MACRLGDTPTCGKWRNFCYALEARLERIGHKLDLMAWDQNFERIPYSKEAKDDLLEVDPLNGEIGDRKFRYLEYPLTWAEIASDTENNEDYDYSAAKEYAPVSSWRTVPVSEWRTPMVAFDDNDNEEDQEEEDKPPKDLWLVQTHDGTFTFEEHDDAVEYAKREVEDGQPRAVIYRAIVKATVEAVVHRSVHVIQKEKPL